MNKMQSMGLALFLIIISGSAIITATGEPMKLGYAILLSLMVGLAAFGVIAGANEDE